MPSIYLISGVNAKHTGQLKRERLYERDELVGEDPAISCRCSTAVLL